MWPIPRIYKYFLLKHYFDSKQQKIMHNELLPFRLRQVNWFKRDFSSLSIFGQIALRIGRARARQKDIGIEVPLEMSRYSPKITL